MSPESNAPRPRRSDATPKKARGQPNRTSPAARSKKKEEETRTQIGPIACYVIGTLVTTIISVPCALALASPNSVGNAIGMTIMPLLVLPAFGIVLGFMAGGHSEDPQALERTVLTASSYGDGLGGVVAGVGIHLAITPFAMFLLFIPQIYIWAYRPLLRLFGIEVVGDIYNRFGFKLTVGRKRKTQKVAVCTSCRNEVPSDKSRVGFYQDCPHCETAFKVDKLQPSAESQKAAARAEASQGVVAGVVANAALWGLVVALLIGVKKAGDRAAALQQALPPAAPVADARPQNAQAPVGDPAVIAPAEPNPDANHQPFGEHADVVMAVAISPNGQLCASAGADRRVMVWEVANRIRKHDFGPVEDKVLDLVWSPDGQQIACGLGNGHLALVSVPGGETQPLSVTGLQQATAIAFHPNGKELFCAGIEGVIRQIRIETGEVTHEWNAHALKVQQLVVSADGSLLVSSSLDGTLLCWDIAAGEPRQRLIGHSDAIAAHDVSPDGQRVVSLQLDGELRRWDVETGRTLDRSPTEYRVARAVRFLPAPNRVIIVTGTKAIGVFDWRERKTILRRVALHDHLLSDAAFTRDDPPQVVSGGFDHKIFLAKLDTLPAPNADSLPVAEKVAPRGLWREWTTNVANSSWWVDPQSNQFLAVARQTNLEYDSQRQESDLKINEASVLRGWRAESGQLTTLGSGLELPHNFLYSASTNGRQLVTAEMTRLGQNAVQVRLWEQDASGQLSNVRPLEFPIHDVRLTPMEKEQLSPSELSRLDGRVQRFFPIRSIVVSPSGRWAAIGTKEHTICFYDLQSAKLVRQFFVAVDRRDPLREKVWNPLSHQPVFLSDEEFLAGGFVINTTRREYEFDRNISGLNSESSRDADLSWVVASVPEQRRLFVAQGREVRELRVPIFADPIPASSDSPSPQPTGRDARRAIPRAPMPAKKATKPAPTSNPQPAPLWTFQQTTSVTALAVSPGGTIFATGEESGQLNLWNLVEGKLLKSVMLDVRPIRRLEFISNGERIASGHEDGAVRIWNLAEFNDGS